MDQDDKIAALCKSRHPSYEEMLPHWTFLDATYEGGRGWFKGNIHRYHKEGSKEYKDRVARAYRFNHTREIVNLINKYVFKTDIKRSENAPQEIKDFWGNATRDGSTIDQYIRRVDINGSKLGKIWIVVDSTATGAEVTQADAKKSGARPYSYMVTPMDALNMSFDEDGNLNWILIRETIRDDADPMNFTGKVGCQYRLWTKKEWVLFAETKNGSRVTFAEKDRGVHDLGIVPVFEHNAGNDESEDPYSSPATINDIAYLDRACANYLSNLDAIIQDQTFSQLAIPAGARTEDGNSHVVELGTKRVFEYNADTKGAPFYLSPDVKQAELIITAIKQVINEIYHSVGMAGERTKQDNSSGIDNSSGVAKAIDFDRVASLLVMKAKGLQATELKLIYIAQLYRKVAEPKTAEEDKTPLVTYPETFDVRGLEDELAISQTLSLLAAPAELQREQMRRVVRKMFADSEKKTRDAIEAEIKEWPMDPLEMIKATAMASGKVPAAPGKPGSPTPTKPAPAKTAATA